MEWSLHVLIDVIRNVQIFGERMIFAEQLSSLLITVSCKLYNNVNYNFIL